MRPPICEICDTEFDLHTEGGLIYFKETPKGREFSKRVEKDAIIGHPPDAGWFCKKHYPKAKQLQHLTLSEAINQIRK
jgi:hypothetical protein